MGKRFICNSKFSLRIVQKSFIQHTFSLCSITNKKKETEQQKQPVKSNQQLFFIVLAVLL